MEFLQLLAPFVTLLIVTAIAIYLVYQLKLSIFHAPYVPSTSKSLNDVFESTLKKVGKYMILAQVTAE